MDQSKEAQRSSTTMAASNGVPKRRQSSSENGRRPEKKDKDAESLNRSKRRRSERFATRNEGVVHRRKSFTSGLKSSHAAFLNVAAEEIIGVAVPRKARSACIKRSHNCPDSSGSYSFEAASPSSSIKQKKHVIGSKSRVPKPPKSTVTIEDDLEIEIAEVLSGLKKQPHSSINSSEVKGDLRTCKAQSENIDKSTNGTLTSVASVEQKTPIFFDSSKSNGVSESNGSKLEINLMVPPPSPERVSLFDSIVTKDDCKQDGSVKCKEMTSEEVKVEKRQCLNLDLETLSQETAQPSSVLPLTVAAGSYGHRFQNGNNGSTTLVQEAPFSASQPSPKRCATHFFIAQNIQLHQKFVKTNHLSQPNKASLYQKSGELRPAAGILSSQGNSPILRLNSQAQDRIEVAPKDKASETESGYVSKVPAQAFIFPPNHHLQPPVMVPSKAPRPTNMAVNNPSSSAREGSPYFTAFPDNAYSFQLSSSIRGQALPFINGSFYSPQKLSHDQKATSCSSSSHRQLQPQVSLNSLPSQHRQQSQKSEAGDTSDSRGSHTQKGGTTYGQIMTSTVQPQNFTVSFGGGSASASLNFSSSGYHVVSAPPLVHQASDSKTGRGGKPPAMMNGQTLVFDNPSRTLNFVSGTWPTKTIDGDSSVFMQQSGRSKTTPHSQAESVPPMTSFAPCNYFQCGQTQISFAAPSKLQQGRITGNSKVNKCKTLPSSHVPSSATHTQDQPENSASPVCRSNLTPIITSCPGRF